VTDSTFKRAVALLAVLRVLPALVVLAANGTSLPLLPGYAYGQPTGDTYGFYAAAREFISAWAHVSKPLLALAVVGLAAVAYGVLRLWRSGRRAEAVVVGVVAVSVFVSLAIRQMGDTGAGAVGWPIVWSLPLFPLRAAGALGYHGAYYLGNAIVLACNVVTLVATALVARRLLPPRYALVAPALLVVWPFLMRIVEGTGNGVYGSWLDDVGPLLYAEPLSTALIAVALALFVLRRRDATAAAVAGALTSFATAVRISNVTLAGVFFVAYWLASTRRAATMYTLACAGTAVIAAEFWTKGYSSFKNKPSDQAPDGLFSWHYLVRSWRDSTVFDWKMLAILLPLPLLGIYALRRRRIEVLTLAGVAAVTAAFYSAYYITALHPRFLYVALPSVWILAAAGITELALRAPLGGAPAVRDDRRDRAENETDQRADDQ
jgi:hypothetical protein